MKAKINYVNGDLKPIYRNLNKIQIELSRKRILT